MPYHSLHVLYYTVLWGGGGLGCLSGWHAPVYIYIYIYLSTCIFARIDCCPVISSWPVSPPVSVWFFLSCPIARPPSDLRARTNQVLPILPFLREERRVCALRVNTTCILCSTLLYSTLILRTLGSAPTAGLAWKYISHHASTLRAVFLSCFPRPHCSRVASEKT